MTAKLKAALIERYGQKCHLYGEEYPERLLQPDHRIPYEIGGDPEDMMDTDYFMLLCPSANRDKSWACEHCENWTRKNAAFCRTCYYAFPEHYEHIAGDYERRVDLIFKGDEIPLYDRIIERSKHTAEDKAVFIKRAIAYYMELKKK